MKNSISRIAKNSFKVMRGSALQRLVTLAGVFSLTACNVPQNSELSKASSDSMRFGVAPQWYQNYNPPSESPANVDIVVVGDWLLQQGFTAAHHRKLSELTAKGKTPYIFGYIATGKIKEGLGDQSDCDGDLSRKLCQQGASYLRSHIDSDIVPAYRSAALQIANATQGRGALIHMEPDWYQFSEKAQQAALTRAESNDAMNKMLRAIKEGCPTCQVVIDFSPWFSPDRTQWAKSAGDFYEGWDRSIVKYVGLTGKQFPFTEGKIDNFTYKQITTELSLPLVVVSAYTFGGGPIDVDNSWLASENIEKAWAMGITTIIMSQQGDVRGFNDFIVSRGKSAAEVVPNRDPPPSKKPVLAPAPVPAPAPVLAPAPESDGESAGLGGRLEVKSSIGPRWEAGFCVSIQIKNIDSKPVQWTVRIPKKGVIFKHWNGSFSVAKLSWDFTGQDWNKVLVPGAATDFGYCVESQ